MERRNAVYRYLKSIGLSVILAVTTLTVCGVPAAFADHNDNQSEIRILSSPPDMVSGGEALVQVKVPRNSSASDVTVTLNGQDITGDFHAGQTADVLVGLVTGLALGDNRLEVHAKDHPTATLGIIDYPISGPIFSGPHQEPFICQTQTFVLPVTGGTLGAPLDADCSIATRFDYVYMSTSGALKPLPNPTVHPGDLAQTTTTQGRTVNYIVRVETGTINRAVYRIAILHDPVVDAAPDPWHPPPGWNGRVLYTFGGGCGTGHHQGQDLGVDSDVLNNPQLGNAGLTNGFAMVASSLNVFGTNCDDVISAETAMMVKEHFINNFGVPKHTIGIGASGGSMQVHLLSFNYPSLLDGIIPGRSFPDTVTFELPYQDCGLLVQAFATSTLAWTPQQQTAVAGVNTFSFCTQNIIWGQLITPNAGPVTLPDVFPGCDPSLPTALLYDPVSNPSGIRCTLFDDMMNVYGRDPTTGFAPRPVDNVGIQYGLVAFNAGKISFDQFADLNARIGGYDVNGNIVSTRTVADLDAVRIAYQTGRLNSGQGLNDIPIIDWRDYLDASGNVHDAVRSLVMRARLIASNGNADNQVIIKIDPSANFAAAYYLFIAQMEQWLNNIESDNSKASRAVKVARDKPTGLVDACYTASLVEITDAATCEQLYPSSLEPRLAAGEPLTNDFIKCQLKPVDPRDYSHSLTSNQLAQLKTVFPQGVCDYSRRGVEQQALAATWLSYPSPGEFDLTGESKPTLDRDDFNQESH
jgi:hypothetical protein